MTPLYLIGEPADESRHAGWMRDRGRRGFDARQFREQVGQAAANPTAAVELAAECLRGLATHLTRAFAAAIETFEAHHAQDVNNDRPGGGD